MAIRIKLVGRCDDTSLDAVEAALAPYGAVSRDRDEAGLERVALTLHPAAEPLTVVCGAAGRWVAEANTVTAGPGYHGHVCQILGALTDSLGIVWDPSGDPTGYFARRDRAALERAMLEWLAQVAGQILAIEDAKPGSIQLSLPAEARFTHRGFIATVLGPRDRAWVERAAQDASQCADVFPWWHEGEGAEALRGKALAAMWIDVRWRPAVQDVERTQMAQVVRWLEGAHALDPQLELPWREWAELQAFLGEESLLTTRTQLRAEAAPRAEPIGYRRQSVRVTLSGDWSIVVPGELAERWDERGTWVGWDATRTLWFNSLELSGSPSAEATLEELEKTSGAAPELRLDRGPLLLRASVRSDEEEGRPVTVIEALAALESHAAIATMVLADDADREWALDTWASLHHPSMPQ